MSIDFEFYRSHYKDLTHMSEMDAKRHFSEFGQQEGRFPTILDLLIHMQSTGILPSDFDPHLYIYLNPDIPRLSTALEAIEHYLAFGRSESRIYKDERRSLPSSTDRRFDVDFYRAYYDDMKDVTCAEAKRHFETTGALQGRHGSQAAFLADVERECRRLPEDFDPAGYLHLNPELRSSLKQPWDPAFHYLRYGIGEGRRYKRGETIYSKSTLNASLASVYDMPEIVVDEHRCPTINMLVPAFDFGSMSAGFFGLFQTALFVQSCGYHVRLVMYDRFDFDEDYMREKLRGYPGLEHLLDRVETSYIGDRAEPLRVSPHDNCIATVWYSAYLARKISTVVHNKSFMYLIQDYETAFYANSSLNALADATYAFNYNALFSTKSLQTFFFSRSIGRSKKGELRHTFFNNACSRSLPKREQFLSRKRKEKTKRLAFYSRPVVNRNMFEIGALALCQAVEEGLFADEAWEFFGIGLGDAVVKLSDTITMTQLPRMNLRDYQEVISTFDVGLCLMASSHPSLLPFDLAGSGAVVVTNLFGVKDQSYFDELVPGVITAEPDVPSLVRALRRATQKTGNLEARYANAHNMTFPASWGETWDRHHEDFVHETFSGTPMRPVDRVIRFPEVHVRKPGQGLRSA